LSGHNRNHIRGAAQVR